MPDEEINQSPTPEVSAPTETSVLAEIMKTLASMQETQKQLQEENKVLREAVKVSAEEQYSLPGHLRVDGAGVPHNPDAARSVTIVTRPVRDSPHQYQNIVDPGGLSVNGASPMSGANKDMR